MRFKNNNLFLLNALLFAFTVTIAAAAAADTLLEFHQISQINLIVRHENVQISPSNVISEMENLLDDLDNFNCTANDCEKGKKFITAALLNKNSTLMSLFTDDESGKALTRKKREWDYFGKSLKWMGGVMDSDDRQVLNRKVNILYENQKTIYDQLEKALSGLTSKPEALKAERGELNQVEKDLKHVHELISLQTLSERYGKISALIDGIWRTFFNKKIDGIFITSDVLERLRNLPNLACGKIGECIKNADASVQFESSRFTINLRIPLTSSDRFLQLYEITSIPSDLESQIIFLKFPQKYFAFDESNKKIIVLKENSLSLCRASDDSTKMTTMYCRVQDIVVNVNTDECLEKAFRDKIVDSAVCDDKMELLQASGGFGVIEIGNGRFWVHTKNRKDVAIYCNENDKHEVKTFTHSQTFSLDYGCHALFRADGIDLTSYSVAAANDDDESQKLRSINSSISKADFIDIIESMTVSNYLKSGFQINLETYQPKGLVPLEIDIVPETAATANELKTIRAQHSEALLIVVIIAISLMLYVAMSKGKPYIQQNLLPLLQHKKNDDIETVQHESEQNLKINDKM